MASAKGHMTLARTAFDLLQLVYESDGWTISISRKKKFKRAGEVLFDQKKIVIYSQAHLGGDIGSMAFTLLHEQIHAFSGVQENDNDDVYKREEALVEINDGLIYDALDDGRKAHLEYLLRT